MQGALTAGCITNGTKKGYWQGMPPIANPIERKLPKATKSRTPNGMRKIDNRFWSNAEFERTVYLANE